MPDEATPEGYEIPAGTAEPKNVRESIAMRKELGDPGFADVTEEGAHAYPDGTPNGDTEDFSDLFPADGATPQPKPEVAAPQAPAVPVAEDPYASYGGKAEVDNAIVLAQALRTESGVRTIVAQGLQALGYTPDEVSAFMQRQAAAEAAAAPQAPADPFAGIAQIEDDDVVTGADVKALLSHAVRQITDSVTAQVTQAQQQAVLPLQEQIQQDRTRAAQHAVDTTFVELLKIENNAPNELQLSQMRDVQAFAAQYLTPDDWNPANIRNALIRGHADMQARDEARFKAYVETKRQAKSSSPANIGGGVSPGGEALPEPKNVKEAIEQRKKLGIF